MSENTYGSCEGCVDNQPNNGWHNGIPDCDKKRLKEPCPCKICLIKVMCNKACDEFIEYAIRNKKELIDMKRQQKYENKMMLS